MRLVVVSLAVGLAILAGGRVLAGDDAPGTEPWDAAREYAMNCAPCHGASGRLDPASPQYANFRRAPADFTVPRFNSMEPSADWFMVIKHGGRPMGLSDQMPAYVDAYDDDALRAMVSHLKTLAETRRYPPGDMNYLRPIRSIKAFPETELLLLTRYDSREDGSQRTRHTVYYGRRFGPALQGEVKLNRNLPSDGDDASEMELGVKWAFHHDARRAWLLATGLEAEIPLNSGDASSVGIPYLSFAHGLSNAFTLQGTCRSHLPLDDLDQGDVEVSAIVHWTPSPWPRSMAPALEAIWREPFHGQAEVTAMPQLYAGVNRRGHVAVAVGLELPITDAPFDYRVHGFLLWDIADGPLWQGW